MYDLRSDWLRAGVRFQVGAGTVVGSELFNMLCIVGGVCLVTPTALTLDWRPLAREVFFFTISLIGIISALADEEVTLTEALVLTSGYAAYVAVCANYPALMRIFCPASGGGDGDQEFYIDFNLEEMSTDADANLMDNGDDIQMTLNGASLTEILTEILTGSLTESLTASRRRVWYGVW
jgi:hypothetical protein